MILCCELEDKFSKQREVFFAGRTNLEMGLRAKGINAWPCRRKLAYDHFANAQHDFSTWLTHLESSSR